jgi:hypothetical protein
MASDSLKVGLLGFIGGVSKGIADEYDRQKEIGADIDKENRAEERAVRADKRRTAAEMEVAEYRKRLDLKMLPEETKLKAELEAGLIKEGTHPELMLDSERKRIEAERIKGGEDPTMLRSEEDKKLDLKYADQEAQAAANKQFLSTSASERAQLEYDAIRQGREEEVAEGFSEGKPLYKTGTQSATSESRVSFTVSEASKQLTNDLSAIHGLDLGAIRERMKPLNGGSRLSELRAGEESLSEILSDAGMKEQLREEVALKLHNAADRQLKDAAKAKKIQSLDEVTQLSDVIADRADKTIQVLEKSMEAIGRGQDPAAVSEQIHEALRMGWGEPEEEKKQSTAFRAMWGTFKAAYNKK